MLTLEMWWLIGSSIILHSKSGALDRLSDMKGIRAGTMQFIKRSNNEPGKVFSIQERENSPHSWGGHYPTEKYWYK